MADQNENQADRKLSPELQAFEAQLASLLPTTGGLQRDRLMFEAGKAAAEAERRRPASAARWVRSAASIAITAAATFVLTAFALRPQSLAVKNSIVTPAVSPKQIDSTPHPAAAPSMPELVSAPDTQSPRTLVTWLFPGRDRTNGLTNASYFRQRNMVLALGADRLPELKKTGTLKDTSQNTRVSYMDLLDELVLERHGFAPGDSGSEQRKPPN